jgi:hypothetical protein
MDRVYPPYAQWPGQNIGNNVVYIKIEQKLLNSN